MAKALLLLLSNLTPGSDPAEFNRWYDDIHAIDILDVKATVKCTRYRVSTARLLPEVLQAPRHEYAAIYEIEAETDAALSAVAAEINALRFRPEGLEISPTIDMPNCTPYFLLPLGDEILPRPGAR